MLTPVRIINNVNVNSRNIVKNVDIFDDSVIMDGNFKEYY